MSITPNIIDKSVSKGNQTASSSTIVVVTS
jgi:hypothetical protein